MTSTDPERAVPEPGREGAAGATTEGVQDAELDEDAAGNRVLRRRERSGAGPGAGEEDVVSVETGVQRASEEEMTRHPTLREKPGGEDDG